jgi:GT2 family glycosyltransferase
LDATVVIPVLNEGARLRRCVRAALGQHSPGGFEVVVVDGGSEDGCLDGVEELGARVLEAPGTGAGEARNIGASEARGDVLAFTDGDCIPQTGWLDALVHALRARRLGGVGGALCHMRTALPAVCEDLETRFFYRGCITSNVAYHRDVFAGVGGFDPRLRCAEDWDLAWRVQEAGHRMAFCPEALVMHDPSENSAYRAFLRKQVWYARNDVPALLANARGIGGSREQRVARSQARQHLGTAMLHAAGSGLVATGVLAPAGAALLGAWAMHRVARMAVADPESRSLALRLTAHMFTKALFRGWGTWAGLVDVARGGRISPPSLLRRPPARRSVPRKVAMARAGRQG